MKPLGGANNQVNTANSQLVQKRALDKNISRAQQTNVTTVGRQVNRTTEDEKKTSTLQAPPKEQVTLSATKLQNPVDAEKASSFTATAEQPEVSSSSERGDQVNSPASEALESFSDALFGLDKKDVESINTQAAGVGAANEGAGADPTATLAAVALQTAVTKLQAKMPNATAEQLKEAAKSDPEIAKWSKVADTAKNYLTQLTESKSSPDSAKEVPPSSDASKGQSSERPGMNGPMTDSGNPFRLTPEQQAQYLADQQKMQESIRNTYAQMWAEIRKGQAERMKLMLETNEYISNIFKDLHVAHVTAASAYNTAITNAILGIKPG